MLLTANPTWRVKLCGQDVVGGLRRLLLFGERGLGEGQAHGSLVCDLFGAELTVMMFFAGNDLSTASMRHPKGMGEAWVTTNRVAQGMA